MVTAAQLALLHFMARELREGTLPQNKTKHFDRKFYSNPAMTVEQIRVNASAVREIFALATTSFRKQ